MFLKEYRMIIVAAILVIANIFWYVRHRRQKKKLAETALPSNATQLLTENVPFYNKLNDKDKDLFEARIKDFLANTTIRGIDVDVDDLDRILIASGAITLILSFLSPTGSTTTYQKYCCTPTHLIATLARMRRNEMCWAWWVTALCTGK